MRPLRSATLLLAAAMLASCAQLQFYWVHDNEPLPTERAVALGERQADLQTCLAVLGAPDRVWESPQGVVLSYGWLHRFFWQFDIVVYGTDLEIEGRTLFSFASTHDGYDGIVLVFGDDLNLRFVRFGQLSDITRDLPRRPTAIE